jgi:prepilin-type N-terminal cleavage/methylation domain-containing protein
MMRGQAGFSLVEVLIALALVGGLSLGIASVVDMSVKAERTAAMSADHLELINVIRQIMSVPSSCTANLGLLPLDTTPPHSPGPVTIMYTKPDLAHAGVAVKDKPIVTNGRYGKIRVNRMEILPYADLTSDVWLVKVRVIGEKTGSFLGGKDLIGEVSAQVRIDVASKKILQCLGSQDLTVALTEENVQLNDKICQVSSDGAKIYDPKLKMCTVNDDCYEGNLTTASCPAGSRIVGCSATGFQDPVPVFLTRKFRNGTSRGGGPPPFYCDMDAAKNSAVCEYAQGVNIAAAKCKACCRSLSVVPSS